MAQSQYFDGNWHSVDWYIGHSLRIVTVPRLAWWSVTLKSALLPILAALSVCLPAYAAPAHALQPYRPGQTFRDCPKTCPEMVVIPAGAFLMGSPADEPHYSVDPTIVQRFPKVNWDTVERPRHRVAIGYSFAVGKFDITRDQYASFATETHLHDPDGCNVHEPPNWPTIMGLSWHMTPFPQTGRDPVVCVSWEEARAYTQWLSRKTGHSYRLLSEAEWEYVARAGTTTEAYWGNDEKRACGYANGVDLTLVERFPKAKWDNVMPCHDGYVNTAPVGSFKPNTFGLYDTLGNVAEWLADCWSWSYDGAPTDGSARTDGNCAVRANRGGTWTSDPSGLRVAARGWDRVSTRVVDLGFRVARDL